MKKYSILPKATHKNRNITANDKNITHTKTTFQALITCIFDNYKSTLGLLPIEKASFLQLLWLEG